MWRMAVGFWVLSVGWLAADNLQAFEWKYRNLPLGKLKVPRGFKAKTVNYTEGVLTTLIYGDGSKLLLQRGGMYAVPMLHDPEYIVDAAEDNGTNSTRCGHHAGAVRVWAERNFKNAGRNKPTGFLLFFPPNIAYLNVPPARKGEFDHALDSFRH